MSNELYKTFLSLIRLGIGHPVTDLPEAIDWETVHTLASEQGLLAIVLDGAQALTDKGELAEGRSMDKALKKQWIGTVIQNYEWKYEDYRKRIGQLAKFYNGHGFKLMVVKGYGLSLNYPIPQHRPCGDIDIWAFGKYKEADEALSRELSIPVDSAHHHHTTFSFKGYLVENHYDFVNVHYGHGNDKLEAVFKKLAMDDSAKVEIDGQAVCLPSANLHALFVLRHTMLHFASTEMNLRQVLDWGLLIEKHGPEIDWTWFMDALEEYHMTDFFRCLNAICVEDLGFDASVFPDSTFDGSLKNRVLHDTISPEFDEQTPAGFFRRIAFKYRRWQANAWKQDLCYGDSRFKSFWTGVWAHLIKPEMI